MYSDQTDKIQHTKPTTELFPYTTKNVIETETWFKKCLSYFQKYTAYIIHLHKNMNLNITFSIYIYNI